MASVSRAGKFDIGAAELTALSKELSSVSSLREHLTKAFEDGNYSRVSRVLEEIMAAAFSLRASDVHLEPEEEGVRLRLRLDGVLTDIFQFDRHAYRLLANRIKLLSGLKLNVSDRAQDGRFSVPSASG